MEQVANNNVGIAQTQHQQVRNQRKKKLFDDSDSDREEPQETHNDKTDQQQIKHIYDKRQQPHDFSNRDHSPGANRSNLVNKIFYKEQF